MNSSRSVVKKALFSAGRIHDSDVPDGMYRYDLREGDGFATTYFGSIEQNVLCDHAGSIITNEPIDFGTDGYIEFDYDTEPNFLGEQMTVDEFAVYRGGEYDNT